MICPNCRGEYRDGFIECADCKIPLVEEIIEEEVEIIKEDEEIVEEDNDLNDLPESKEAQRVVILEQELSCQICKHNMFIDREVPLNAEMAESLDLDGGNDSAICFVCDKCGYIHWFLPNPHTS